MKNIVIILFSTVSINAYSQISDSMTHMVIRYVNGRNVHGSIYVDSPHRLQQIPIGIYRNNLYIGTGCYYKNTFPESNVSVVCIDRLGYEHFPIVLSRKHIKLLGESVGKGSEYVDRGKRIQPFGHTKVFNIKTNMGEGIDSTTDNTQAIEDAIRQVNNYSVWESILFLIYALFFK